MGGIHDFFGKDLQGGGLMMWSLPPGEVGGAKSASHRQSRQTEILLHTTQICCKRPQRIVINPDCDNSGIGRTQPCFPDAFIICTVRIHVALQ